MNAKDDSMENIENIDMPLSKPITIVRAERIIYASLVVGLIKLFVGFSQYSTGGSAGSLICNLVPTFGIIIFLTIMISRGKNWARIVFAVFYAVGLFLFIPFTIHEFSVSFVLGLLGVLQAIMQLIATILLFQKESGTWFKPEN